MDYILYPHTLVDILEKDKLWKQQEIKLLLQERVKVLGHLNNTKKDIDFLAKNSLVFMFQKNIIKDEKLDRYTRWFRFAEKTRDGNNIKEDFNEFRGDEIFEEIINSITTQRLVPNDIEYIKGEKQLLEGINQWEIGKIEEGIKISKKEGFEIGEVRGLVKTCKKMILNGIDMETIIKVTGFTKERIQEIKDQIIHNEE